MYITTRILIPIFLYNKNYIHNYSSIQYIVKKPKINLKNNKFKIDHTLRLKRIILQAKNIMNNYKNNCSFCYGTGYIDCTKCNMKGCWRCNNTTLEICPYCNGDGKPRINTNPIDIMFFENNNFI